MEDGNMILSQYVCVFALIRKQQTQVSVLILRPRETQALWSQTFETREKPFLFFPRFSVVRSLSVNLGG